MTCPKCKMTSGNDWSQCNGSCPMPMSPYYKSKIDKLYSAMDELNDDLPRQGFSSRVLSDRTTITFFQDYFGANYEDRLALYQAERDYYENPEEMEQMFKNLVNRDPQPRAKHVRLKDISSDGRIYL